MDLSNPSCGICHVANHRSWDLPIRKKFGLFFLGEQRKTFLFQSSLNKLPPSNFHVLVNFCFQLHAMLLFWTSPSASIFVSKHCWSGYIILNTVTNRLWYMRYMYDTGVTPKKHNHYISRCSVDLNFASLCIRSFSKLLQLFYSLCIRCSFQNMLSMGSTVLVANFNTSCKIVDNSNALHFGGFPRFLLRLLPSVHQSFQGFCGSLRYPTYKNEFNSGGECSAQSTLHFLLINLSWNRSLNQAWASCVSIFSKKHDFYGGFNTIFTCSVFLETPFMNMTFDN